MRGFVFYLCVFLGYGIPIVGLQEIGSPGLMIILSAIGMFWMFAYQHKWGWFNSLGLIVGVIANALCTWFYLHPTHLIFSMCTVLIAWDMGHFFSSCNKDTLIDHPGRLFRSHRNNIGIFFCIASLLSYGSVFIQLKISFVMASTLLIFAFAGLLILIRKILVIDRII